MPLSKKKQKDLNALLSEIITEISSSFQQNNDEAFNHIKFAIGLPNELSDDAFAQQISLLDEGIKEKLTELRDLYLNKNPVLNDANPEDMKTYVKGHVLSECEKKFKATAPVTTAVKSAETKAVEVEETPLKKIARILDLKPGDIIISEMPFENPTAKDFDNFRSFTPGHTSVWTGEQFDRPFAHSVREGYRPPGLKVSGIWEGRHMVFRYNGDPSTATQASSMIRKWASAETIYSKEKYIQTYPPQFWDNRHERDLKNYFNESKEQRTIAGPATPYGGARAFFDIANLEKNKDLAKLGEEGIRRAIKFAALQNLEDASVSKKGQRCTPIVTAAFQASILAPIVIPQKSKIPFKQFKGRPFLEYADQVLIPNWRSTPLGQALLKAVTTQDYSEIFPAPFSVDQRYALPNKLFSQLSSSPDFEKIGNFSYFKDRLVLVEKETPQVRIHTQASSLKRG